MKSFLCQFLTTFDEMRKYLFFISFIGLAILSSCEKDNIEPVIEINSPKTNTGYSIDDDIVIEADIRDNNNIEYIEIQLLDANLLSAQAQKRIEINQDSYHLESIYTITNEEIETGTYYLRVSAFDGVNTQNEYIELNVDGTPLTRLGFIITSQPASDQVEIGMVDLQGSYSQIANYSNRDHIGSAVSSKHQSVQVVGEYTGDLTSVDTESLSEEWSVPIIGSGLPYFTSINHYNELTYVGHYDGQLKAYNENGSVQVICESSSNYYFKNCFYHDGYILAQENDINSSSKRLITYYETGFELQWDVLPIDIKGYGSLNSNEAVLFGNENGQGKIMIYNVNGRSFWEPKTVPTGEIFSAVQIDADTYIIGHETGLLKYSYSQSSITTYSTHSDIRSIIYDELYGQLIIADNNSIKVLDYPNSNPSTLYVHGSPISEVHVLNNR